MAKRGKVTSDPSALTSSPFASLHEHVADVPLGDGPPQEPEATVLQTPGNDDAELRFGPRVIVRRQKKGQGGKTSTCAEGLPVATAQTLLPSLKQELGCSGRLDATTLIVGTADHTKVAQWLRDAGARNVKLGN